MVHLPFWLSVFTFAAVVSLATCADTGNSWMGANLYYLQGLSDSDQNAYIDAMAKDGAKVVRVWVNKHTAGDCQKGSRIAMSVPNLEDKLGVYNRAALDALDKVIVKLSAKGIKALISPHDANSLLGDYRSDVYFDKWGSAGFYQEKAAFDAYDARLSYILNYKGATSGKVWKAWSEAIMGFDLQNEPFTANTSACTNNDAHDWACGRATKLRNELGANSPMVVATGGLGGDYSHGCTFMARAMECKALDTVAIHRYASVPGKWSDSATSWKDQARGKRIFVEEWGISAANYDQAATFPTEAANFNSVGLPTMYWQFLLPSVAQCPYSAKGDSGDHFGIVYSSGVDLSGPMHQARKSKALQDWRSIIPA
ncbi:beta-1-3-mannanase [Apiospora kogelbergensis]|uniref:beta-1-3-mannanase n=1 Tax=Apiospora kogelbergensis TaxID=1337665 RepID=UPI00312DA026